MLSSKRKDGDMSLGIAIKGPEGIVLAADSRVTLTGTIQQGDRSVLLPATFDNATKLLQVIGQEFVGAVTYGVGAIGEPEPRTAHSFMPEFERRLPVGRMLVEDFAQAVGNFFMEQWSARMPQDYSGPPMIFLVAGYDEDAPYGRIFEIDIPMAPGPREWHTGGQFGPVWGGQMDYVNRLLHGYDRKLPSILQGFLGLSEERKGEVENHLRANLSIGIPYQFLPLQDCVDLSIFLIKTTVAMQNSTVGVRGVGGAIDAATITRTEGFKAVQQKEIVGEIKAVSI